MIRNNLAKLLVERGIKAVKASNDTGIAQSTLSKISNNDTEKIDYSTINTLCKYLKITPCEFFEYSPIDVEFTFFLGDLVTEDKELAKGAPMEWESSAFINFFKFDQKIGSIELSGSTTDLGPVRQERSETIYGLRTFLSGDNHEEIDKLLSYLSVSFIADIEKRLKKFIEETLLKEEFPYREVDKYIYEVDVSVVLQLPF